VKTAIWAVYQEARTRAERRGILDNSPTNVAIVHQGEPASASTRVEALAATGLPEIGRETRAHKKELRAFDNETVTSARSTNETAANLSTMAQHASCSSTLSRNSSGENSLALTAVPDKIDRNKPNYDLLKRESVRLSTYYDWPYTAKKRPGELAAEGFFYAGMSDRVQCAFCKEHLRNWAAEDIISVEHSRHFPNCSFVRCQGDNIRDVSKSSPPTIPQRPSWMSDDGSNGGKQASGSATAHSVSTI